MSKSDEQQTPVRIVVVDDDHAILHSLSFSLRLEGFEVETFDSGAAFLAAPEPKPPACAIIDHDLNGIKGLNVAEAMRARGSHLPLIMMSGTVTPRLRTLALAAGFRAVLEKPLFGDELGDALAHAVASSDTQ